MDKKNNHTSSKEKQPSHNHMNHNHEENKKSASPHDFHEEHEEHVSHGGVHEHHTMVVLKKYF